MSAEAICLNKRAERACELDRMATEENWSESVINRSEVRNAGDMFIARALQVLENKQQETEEKASKKSLNEGDLEMETRRKTACVEDWLGNEQGFEEGFKEDTKNLKEGKKGKGVGMDASHGYMRHHCLGPTCIPEDGEEKRFRTREGRHGLGCHCCHHPCLLCASGVSAL
ncbi:hypothetical protein K470DRAFT_264334 [Piedraia hortae CBS 480.64]|uniref:Uncharacterized protein n=1 Tax=Piedraia hortae CBS 480.64 TaxID=1314780 RepID=A0A6A7C219_9PEZI|nr:hypothetical protein K470DRAFT_264334 [Piedraia hortae CBS 480.64]